MKITINIDIPDDAYRTADFLLHRAVNFKQDFDNMPIPDKDEWVKVDVVRNFETEWEKENKYNA